MICDKLVSDLTSQIVVEGVNSDMIFSIWPQIRKLALDGVASENLPILAILAHIREQDFVYILIVRDMV